MDEVLSAMPLVLQQPEIGDQPMDAKVWRALPDELVDRVLACLPVPMLLQCRLLCKRWKSLVFSAPFMKLRAEAPYSGPHFLVFESHKLERWGAYNPSIQKWYSVPSADFPDGGVLSVCADGGLLCVVTRSNWYGGPTQLLLCDPVTNLKKELPTTWVSTKHSPTWIPSLVRLVVDQDRKSFKVIAAGYSGCAHHFPTCLCLVTEVYDSVTDRWERAGDLPWLNIEFIEPSSARSHAVCDGHLYCVVKDDVVVRDERDHETLRLMSFDLESCEWSVVHMDMPQLSGAQVLLFENRRSLMLVQQQDKYSGVPRIYTWRPGLHAQNKWTVVPSLPPRYSKKFEELFQFDGDLMWAGRADQLFFVSHKWDRALLYDILKKLWTITPASKSLKEFGYPLLAIPFDFNLQGPLTK